MESDKVSELLCFHRFLPCGAESPLVRPASPSSLWTLGPGTFSSPALPPPQAEAGCSPLEPAESVNSMRRIDPLPQDHLLRDLASEREYARLPWSPPPLTIDVMTATSAPVNVGNNQTQTISQYLPRRTQSFQHPPAHNNNLSTTAMAAHSVITTPSVAYQQQTASPYLGHNLNMAYCQPPASSSSYQLSSPAMSRTPSFGNPMGHYGVNGANHIVSPAPSGDTANDQYGPSHINKAVWPPFNTTNVTHRRDSDESTEAEGSSKPYASLIFDALMSKADKRMVLREIYGWFEKNTDKAKDPTSRGWQNSIRHNLSMNGAFHKHEQEATPEDGKKGYVWVLDPKAIAAGCVESTTRFRKATPNRGVKRDPAPSTRVRSGARKVIGSHGVRRVANVKTEPAARAVHRVATVPKLEPIWSTHGLPIGNDFNFASDMHQNGALDRGHYPYTYPLTPNSVSPSPTQATHPYCMGAMSDDMGMADHAAFYGQVARTGAGTPSPSFGYSLAVGDQFNF